MTTRKIRADGSAVVMSTSETTKTLLGRVQRAAHRVERAALGPQDHRVGTDRVVFGVAGLIALAFIVWGFVSSDTLGAVADSALNGVLKNFGWLFVTAATVFTVFVVVVALGRFGRIPWGRTARSRSSRPRPGSR
nr:hypothetical protein GCM10025730_19230 [Promicromonospora thailandica]